MTIDIFSGRRIREPISASLRKQALEIAKYKCQYPKCKVSNKYIPLQAHHINLKNDNNRLSNIKMLCPTHHSKVHQKFSKKYKTEQKRLEKKKKKLLEKKAKELKLLEEKRKKLIKIINFKKKAKRKTKKNKEILLKKNKELKLLNGERKKLMKALNLKEKRKSRTSKKKVKKKIKKQSFFDY